MTKPYDSNFPLMVVCPDCKASINAQCTQPKPMGGMMFVSWFHYSRIEAANKIREKLIGPAGAIPEPLSRSLRTAAITQDSTGTFKELDTFDLWGKAY